MIWTADKPTKAGWYWEWNFGYRRIVEVYKWTYIPKDNDLIHRYRWANEELWVTPPGTRDHPVPVGEAFDKDTKWAGPLEPPKEQ